MFIHIYIYICMYIYIYLHQAGLLKVLFSLGISHVYIHPYFMIDKQNDS